MAIPCCYLPNTWNFKASKRRLCKAFQNIHYHSSLRQSCFHLSAPEKNRQGEILSRVTCCRSDSSFFLPNGAGLKTWTSFSTNVLMIVSSATLLLKTITANVVRFQAAPMCHLLQSGFTQGLKKWVKVGLQYTWWCQLGWPVLPQFFWIHYLIWDPLSHITSALHFFFGLLKMRLPFTSWKNSLLMLLSWFSMTLTSNLLWRSMPQTLE